MMARLEMTGWAKKAMEDVFVRFDGRQSATFGSACWDSVRE